MSKVSKVTFNCPECGKEVEFDYYQSINVSLDPELKKKVFNADIFGAVCPHCGHRELIQHPFLYHDMDKKFMVQMGAYSNLLDFKEEFVNNNPLTKDFPALANDTKVLGVTSMFDMITTIIAFDNNLDWRVVQMTLLFLEYNFIKYCNDNKKKVENIKYSRLVEDKNEDGELIAKICVESGQEFYTPFPMPVYEHCLKEYKERLDLIDPFVFDRNMRDHFCNFFEEDFQTQEEHKNDYYYVEDENGNIYLCSIFGFLEKNIKVGSKVLADIKDGGRVTGTIKRIVSWNFLCISPSKHGSGVIVGEYPEYSFETCEDRKSPLEQDSLLETLKQFKADGYPDGSNSFPTEELKLSKMLVCTDISISIEGMEGGLFDEKVHLVKNDAPGKPGFVLSALQRVERDGKTYLAVYTDSKHMPDKKKYFMDAMFDFDTFARIVKADPEYSGIIINQFDEDIVLDVDLIRTYINYRTLTNEDELKKLLLDLKPEEIKFMSQLSYDCIKSVYFDNINPKGLELKYHIKHEQVDKALTRGYSALREIIYARF